MNNHDRLIVQLAATIASGLGDHLLADDNFVEALHCSVADYVSKQGVFNEDVELDIAAELVTRVTVLQD